MFEGKWDELPNLFHDAEIARTLTEDTKFISHEYTLTHKFRKDRHGDPLKIEMEAIINYRASDQVFWKSVRQKGVQINKDMIE